MRHLMMGALAGASLFLATPAHALPVNLGLTAAEEQQVKRGEVVVQLHDTSESTLKDVVCIGYVDATPERIWSVLLDYERYDRIFPRLLRSEVRAKEGDVEDHYTLLDYPWPFEDRWTLNRIVHRPQARAIDWRRVDGTVKEVVGSWRLYREADQTLVVYKVRLDPGVPLVPAWAIDWGTRNVAPDIIRAVRRQVKG